MAERWGNNKGVAQISCFFSPYLNLEPDQIREFEMQLQNKLTQDSIKSPSNNPNARILVDTYSSGGQITVKSGKKSVTCNAMGVGGDFFLFHPMQLITGSYFSDSDLMQDHVILDANAAWQLFGSSDVAGMTVDIGGIPHIVSGVIDITEKRLDKEAGLDGTMIYVPFNTLREYGTAYGMSHYEIVMPSPIQGYALQEVSKLFPAGEQDRVIVENTQKFSLLSNLKVLAAFGTRSMNGKAIIYPFWENLARGYEDIAAVLTFLLILFFIYPVCLIVILIVTLWRHKKWTLKGIVIELIDAKNRRRARRIREKQAKEEMGEEPGEEFL